MTRSESFRPEELARHGESLRRLARRLVRDPALADDLVQEAYAAALASPPRASGALPAWLARVVRSGAAQLRRGAARRSARERLAARPESAPGSAAERLALYGELFQAVGDLREPYRTAVVLRYYEDRPPREIARLLGVPVKTVKTRLARALEELRARLDARHEGDRRAWAVGFARFLPTAAWARPLLLAKGMLFMSAKNAAVAVILASALLLGIWTVGQRGSRAAPERPETVAAVPLAAPSPPSMSAPNIEAERREPVVELGGTPAVDREAVIALESPCVLKGHVLSESRLPVRGVMVSAHEALPRPGWSEATMTEEDGLFELSGVPRGILVDIALSMGNSALTRVLDVDPCSGEVELVVEVEDPDVRIKGAVTTPQGEPVGAQIIVGRPQDLTQILYEADSRTGEFAIDRLRPGTYTVHIWPKAAWADFQSEERRLFPGDEWGLGQVVLQPKGRLLIHSDASDVKARVCVYDLSGRGVASGTLGGDIDRLPPGEYSVEVHGPTVPAQRIPVLVQAGQDTRVDVRLEPGLVHPIAFRFDPERIRRFDRVRCSIEQAGRIVLETELAVEQQGTARFEPCLRPGTYRVRAQAYQIYNEDAPELAGSIAFTVAATGASAPTEVHLR